MSTAHFFPSSLRIDPMQRLHTSLGVVKPITAEYVAEQREIYREFGEVYKMSIPNDSELPVPYDDTSNLYATIMKDGEEFGKIYKSGIVDLPDGYKISLPQTYGDAATVPELVKLRLQKIIDDMGGEVVYSENAKLSDNALGGNVDFVT